MQYTKTWLNPCKKNNNCKWHFGKLRGKSEYGLGSKWFGNYTFLHDNGIRITQENMLSISGWSVTMSATYFEMAQEKTLRIITPRRFSALLNIFIIKNVKVCQMIASMFF